jgi:hypothetical protein
MSDNIIEYMGFLIPYYVNAPTDVETFMKNERVCRDCNSNPCGCDNKGWPTCRTYYWD